MSDAAVAVVAGACGGLGEGICDRFLTDGYRVFGIDRPGAPPIPAQRHSLYKHFDCDVRNRQNVLDLLASLTSDAKRIDVLVNGAMWIEYRSIEMMDEETIDHMVAIGLKSLIWAVQGVLPAMRAARAGSIINFSSIGATVSLEGGSVYGAIKGAVSSLTTQLAVELGPHNVRVNAIAPGPVMTSGARKILTAEKIALRKSRTPLGELADVSDIANLAYFLGSPQSRSLTGEIIHVDGGMRVFGV